MTTRWRSDFTFFGSPDPSVFLIDLLSYGDSVYSRDNLLDFGNPRENLFEVYGDSRENLFEILAVVMIFSPISSVRGTTYCIWSVTSSLINLNR